MKLICEVTDQILVEVAKDATGKQYYIEGIFLQANMENRNGRVYPLDVLVKEVHRYDQAYISQRRALGELGHPESGTINLERVSHLVTEIHQDGNNFVGKARILETPFGKITKALIDDGVKLGVSSRGVGTLKENSRGVQEVQGDFTLCSMIDLVADPSAPHAFVRGIREGKEWVFENGIPTGRDVDRIVKKIEKLPVKQLEEEMIAEFSSFLNKL